MLIAGIILFVLFLIDLVWFLIERYFNRRKVIHIPIKQLGYAKFVKVDIR
jgi:hypothetical protein